jgi:predicted ester cyclase
VDDHRMFELATALAVAKSRQDLPAALRLFHPDVVLEAPPFGVTARGLAENERALKGFFASFPDYAVTLDGHASAGGTLVCWGTARMTMADGWLGLAPHGRPAELPVFLRFTFAGDRIASEHFAFDLAALCARSGVSADAALDRLERKAR